MKAEYINPFIESIESVFQTMLDTSLKRLQARATADGTLKKGDWFSSIIGISGKASGVVALSFPKKTALALAGRFVGSEFADVNPEVSDALAELANMVGGGAKSKFEIDPPPELSLPTVVEGHDYKTKFPTKSVWVEVPFDTPAGEFVMEVSFSKDD
jgi:chemotaxis protein CheX